MDDFPTLPTIPYQKLRQEIRSGDILLCSGDGPFSGLIQHATASVWSHVAFVLRLDVIHRIMILESVENIGVRTVTLSSYVSDYNATGRGYPGRLMIARHEDLRQENINRLSTFATGLLGYPYNREEIIRIAMRIGLGTVGIHPNGPDPAPRKEFICSEYVHLCMQSIGVHIDYDPLGFIAPADFARCQKIKPIGFIDPKEVQKEMRAPSSKTNHETLAVPA